MIKSFLSGVLGIPIAYCAFFGLQDHYGLSIHNATLVTIFFQFLVLLPAYLFVDEQ